MFKAFTDNITSFIGGGEKQSDEEKKDADGKSNENETATEGQSEVGAEDSTAAEQKTEGSGEKKDGKKPPPRPAPPLTPAASVSKPDTPPASPAKSAASEKEGSNAGDAESETGSAARSDDSESKKDKIDEKLDEVAEKAKEWGSYLFSMTKAAGASVSTRAKEIKKAVAENTIVGDFMKEQDKFLSEKKAKVRASEAAVPPWVGYNEEEQMKTQILTLSNDKRNFLRNPPTGVQFHFDYDTCYPVAMATLAEDDKLQKMRFDLVPKMVTEHDFWRNYFYRVSLIKQSTQLTSLSKQPSSTNMESLPSKDQSATDSKQISSEQEASMKKTEDQSVEGGDDEAVTDTPALDAGNDEFISDAYNLEISDEDLMREMEALRASPTAEDAEWEAELQKELNDYEVVGGASSVDEAALEKEIMDEMNKSTEDLK